MDMHAFVDRLGGVVGELFGEGFPGMHGDAAHPGFAFGMPHQEHQPPSSVPPASTKVVRQLPKIKVRPEDLSDPANRECCICLDSIQVGHTVSRLPCAHLFHEKCVKDWLLRNCSCPTCRYELPTDDSRFEIGRMERMKTRKPRFARHELERMPVRELRNLLQRPGVSPRQQQHRRRREQEYSQILDKKDLINHVIELGCIDLVEGAPEPVSYRLSELKGMSIKKLRHVMNEEAGVFYDPKEVVEKSDMIHIFVSSGRLQVIPEEEVAHVPDEPAEDERKPAARPVVDRVHPIYENVPDAPEEDERKPAARLVVETVHSDDEDEAEKIQTNRSYEDLVMEEDPLFRESNSHRAARPKDYSVDSTSSDDSNAKKSVASTADSSATESTPPPAIPVAAAQRNASVGSEDSLPIRLDNLNIDELQAVANDLDVDISDCVSKRKEVDREIALRLAEARRNNQSQDSSSSNHRQDATAPSFVSSTRSSQKRRRTENSVYGFTASDLTGVNATSPDTSARKRALQNKTVSELKELAKQHSVDLSGCLERKEMVDRLVPVLKEPTGSVDEGATQSEDIFEHWNVSEIRALASLVDVDLSSSSSDRQTMLGMIRAAASERPHVSRYLDALAPLARLSVPQLRSRAREWQVSVDDCLEKGDLIHRLVKHKTEAATPRRSR